MRHFVAAAAAYFLAVQQANQRLESLHPLPCGWVLSNRIAARSGLCSAENRAMNRQDCLLGTPDAACIIPFAFAWTCVGAELHLLVLAIRRPFRVE